MSYNSDRDPVGGGFRDNFAARGDGPSCGAGELRGLLQRIADHIADADERQQAVLREMQSRLAHFAEEAHSARPAVPPDLATAFARIEDGIAALTRRLAAENDDQQALHEGQGHDPLPAGHQPAHGGPAPHEPLNYRRSRDQADAPPPRRSDAAFSDDAPPHRGGMGGISGSRAPAEYATEEESHWDPASAEALARLYEPELTGGHHDFSPPQFATFEQTRPAPANAVPTAEARHAPAQGMSGDERAADWMEERFGEIAARIEQTLAGIQPEGSLVALEARLDSLAQKMGSAFSDLATRADVEKLNAVEAHIGELAQHVDRTRSHFGRLDDIESHVRFLIEQISDERFAQLLDQRSFSDSHLARVAEAVVQRLEERQFQRGEVGQAMDRFIELRDMIGQFVSIQRHGDENTAGALATIQQAVLNMLERMEALEQAHAYVQAAAHHGTGEQDAGTGYRGGENFDLHARPSFLAGATASAMFPPEPEVQHALSAVRAEFPAHMAAAPDQDAGDAGPDRAAETVSPLQASREDFLAAARRAARKASSQAAGERAEPARAAMRARGTSASRRAAGSRPVTGLVVATLAVVLAVGIGLTTYSIYRETVRKPAGAIERSLPEHEKSGLGSDATGDIQSAPAEGDAAAPPASKEATRPSNSPAPEGTPEFVIDDLPVVPAPADTPEGAPGRRTVTGLPGGILLDGGTIATTEEIARVQQQHALAQLSTSLGAAQAGAISTPAALVPQSLETLASEPQQVAQTGIDNRALPPAAIGPLSLRLAAANGDPAAEFEVAVRFAEGKGVKQDMKEAVSWYQRSAARGFAPAQYRLGTLYERGLGVKADRGRAMAWYRSAAEKGDLKAMHNLAVLNASGNPANYRTAAYWFAAAAARGLGDSQYNLAVLHETGRGVDRDLKRAFMWFALAARSGDKEAMRRKERVKLMLDAKQLETAEGLVRSWKPDSTEPLVNGVRAEREAWNQREGQS